MKKSLIRFAEFLHGVLFGYMASTGLVHSMESVPSAAEFMSRRVTNPDQSEVIRNRFYDYQLYATAGVAQMTFFAQPVGQGITSALGAVVGSAKTQWDTNLELPNSLPSGKSYMVESIEILFTPGSVSTANTYTPQAVAAFTAAAAILNYGSMNDVNTIYQSGLVEFNVLSKNYLRETPMLAFPPKANFEFFAAGSSTSATAGLSSQAHGKSMGRAMYLQPEVTLQPAMNFEVKISWPAAVATPSGFNGRLGVIMDGLFMRASQ